MGAYKKRDWCILGAILAGLLLLGSFADYSISKAIVDQNNPFAVIMGCIAEYPTGLAGVIAGMLLIDFRSRKNLPAQIGCIAAGAFMILLGSYSNYAEYIGNCDLNRGLLMAITLASTVVMMILTRQMAKNADAKTAVRVALILFIAAVGNTLLVNLVKIPWARPRMRLLLHYPEIPFQDWWVVGNELKEKYLALQVASDGFKSMPSGHTANASVALLLPLLSYLNPKFQGKERRLFWIGAGWVGLCALGRIILGAHFLTDTVIGCTLTVALILLLLVIFKRGPLENAPSMEREAVTNELGK